MFRKHFASLFRRFSRDPIPVRSVGMAWYSESQWPLLLQVSADANQLEKTYSEWLRVAEARYDELVKKGTPVVKIPIDVVDMARWCREMGRKTVDGEGRSLYVTYCLQYPKTAKSALFT
jgi:hypothetical protein